MHQTKKLNWNSWQFSMVFVIFVSGVCNLVVYFNDIHSKKQLLYRIIAPILDLIFVVFPIAVVSMIKLSVTPLIK